MARVQLGGGVTAIAGRVGGSIFQRGKAGQVLKAGSFNKYKGGRTNGFGRQNITSASSFWRSLNDGDRLGWNSLASGLSRLNKFGVPYTPSGFQIFCELNANLGKCAGTSLISVAPSMVSLPSFASLTADFDLSVPEFIIDATFTGTTTGFRVNLECTTAQQGSILSNRQSFSILAKSVGPASFPTDQRASFVKLFGFTPELGQVVFIRAQLIDQTTGQAGPKTTIRTVVHN